MLAAALVVVCSLAGVSLTIARVGGAVNYVTHVVSVLALAGSAISIAMLAARRHARGDGQVARWLAALAVSVALYLVLGAVAVSAGGSIAAVAVGVWSAWWVVPGAVVQLAALHTRGAPRPWIVVLGAVSALAAVLLALFTHPERPFEGLPTIAPEAWSTAPVTDVAAALLFVAMVAAPVLLVVRAARSPQRQRVAGVLAAAAAAVPPLLVVVCVGLAIVRDPGGVEPVFGSVGYLVALSTGCLVAALALAEARSGAPDATSVRAYAGGIAGAYAVVVVVLLGTGLAAALAPAGPFAVVLVVLVVVVACAGGWVRATGVLVALSAQRESESPRARIRDLSARETEVLELVADGSRDAEVAALLHLSERTVEAHLRRIYVKLGLDAEEGRNRRLVAARAYLEAARTEVKG